MSDEVTPDEICGAVLQMLHTLQMIDGLEKIVNERGGFKMPNGSPVSVDLEGRVVRFPFQSNVRQALEAFDRPEIRQALVERLYANELTPVLDEFHPTGGDNS